ncbi:replicase protein [Nerine virus X]|uniref:RNA replication protein n=1 Tax=Nerine virus X TaxID=333348 RepID=Q2V0S0_9VIRU|nr:replicase protein [Nerine virus X]BAE66615.1 replicase protein [Nerine virus X]
MSKVRAALERLNDCSLKAVLQNEAYKEIRPTLREATLINPFAIDDAAADSLESLGIITNPYAVKLHTHGAVKAIENQMLSIVGHNLPKRPVTYMFLKKSKLRYLRRDPRISDVFQNYEIEPRDVARYPPETVLKRFTVVNTDVAYISDTLHFLRPTFLTALFERSHNLQTLYATMVLPPEALHKLPSLEPNLYQINYSFDGFQYIPGRHGGGAYHHEFKDLQWLRVGKIKGPTTTITCQLLESMGANHLFVFRRGDLLTPRVRTFRCDEHVTLPQIFHPTNRNASRPIKHTLAAQLLLYCESIADLKLKDVFAKVRQLVKTNDLPQLQPTEIVHIANYFYFVGHLGAVNTYEDVLSMSLFRKVLQPIKTRIIQIWEKLFGERKFEQLMKALNWQTFTLSVQVTCGRSYMYGWDNANIRPDTLPDFVEDEHTPETETTERPPNPVIAPAVTGFACSPNPSSSSPPPSTHPSTSKSGHKLMYRPKVKNTPTLTQHKSQVSNQDAATHSGNNTPEQAGQNSSTSTSANAGPAQTQATHKADKGKATLKEDIPSSSSSGLEAHIIEDYMDTYSRNDAPPLTAEVDPFLRVNEPEPVTNSEKPDQQTESSKATCTLETDEPLLNFMSPPDWHIEALNRNAPHHEDDAAHTTSTPERAPEQEITEDLQVSPNNDGKPEEPLPWQPWLNILKSVGFKGNETQLDKLDQIIMPISDVRHLPQPDFVPGLPHKLFSLLKHIQRLPVQSKISSRRAKCYASDVKNGRTGLLTRHQSDEWKETFSTLTEMEAPSTWVSVIHGAGGSGKSQALQEYMRSLKSDQKEITIILPTNELRIDWEGKVPHMNTYAFKTFERALIEPVEDICVFDDYGKLPPGYIEAFCMLHVNITCLILTGDSRQSVYHETNAQALIAHLPHAIMQFEPLCRYYLNATHRNPRNLANALGIYSEAPGRTTITMSSRPMTGWPILSPSCAKKTCFGEMGHVAHTYAGCQGLTAPKIQMVLDNNTPLCTTEVMYTALSRAVHNIHFINTGANSKEYWTKLDATPYLKTFLETVREKVVTEDEPPEPKVREEPVRTHVAPDNENLILEELITELPEKHARELYDNHHGHSNAIQTEDPVIQLFQHQQAKDETLLWATIEARIKISSPEANLAEFILKRDIGDILFENYAIAMNVPKEPLPFETTLWQACREEVEKTYLAKPVSALINGSLRQSPDFHPDAISLFLKSQWVKKVEKLGCLHVKPGQTIASFMQETVMVYGTMSRYMRRIRQQHQPAEIFINCEKNPEDMTQFIKQGWNFKRQAYSNDFTAFDQSQDGAMLQFEVIKAKHYGVPADIIEGYLHIKMNAKIFLGTLAIMRLSGEGPTFDANTECSIAYHHTRFHVPSNTRRFFAGDDSAQDCPAVEKSSFQAISGRMSLTSKPVSYAQKPGKFAEFCGWSITPLGVIKDPLKLYASLELACRTDNKENVAQSYALDAKHAYQLGDALHDILTPEQFVMHQKTIRMLHELKVGNLLK